ncbi:hypothetical protein OROHE_009746 [Orobanche hederae]
MEKGFRAATTTMVEELPGAGEKRKREENSSGDENSSGEENSSDDEFPEADDKPEQDNNSSRDENSSDDEFLEADDKPEHSSRDSNSSSGCDYPGKKIWEWTDDELLEDWFCIEGPGNEEYKQRLINRFPALREYLKQSYFSDGFDIEVWPGSVNGLTSIVPLDVHKRIGSDWVESTEAYENLSKLALEEYNRENGTAYMDANFLKVNLDTSNSITYYLTFTAVDPNSSGESKDTSNAGGSEPTRHTFQSQIMLNVIGGR